MSLFPYDKIRPEQDVLIRDIHAAVSSGKCLIAHAPTGLGKTAAALAPALEFAIKSRKTVFFLTSRHTQHAIAVETARLIKEKHKAGFSVTDIVGKKNMCARDDISGLYSRQFHDYCRSLVESGSCSFYSSFRKGSVLTPDSKIVIATIAGEPMHTEEVVGLARRHGICPYEAAVAASKDASLIIADYNYMFSGKIRDSFMRKSGKALEDSIIIIDEAHNLPDRLREMLTDKLSTLVVERAMKEAEKVGDSEIRRFLFDLKKCIEGLGSEPGQKIISQQNLLKPLASHGLAAMLEKMSVIAESVRETGQQSFIGSVAEFLEGWQGSDEGYARILSSIQGQKGRVVTISNQCLDPSLAASEIVRQAHSVIMMSGTLTPTAMYRDILGFREDAVLKEYRNPMPRENRLALVVTQATTKFSKRSSVQFSRIADVCSRAAVAIPGNVILFFPSYTVMEEVHKQLHGKISKAVFKERQDLSKEDKQRLLQEFKGNHVAGGVLLAVIGGNFSEGIDLPGTLLNGVIVVGLPLGQPDLFTKELIRYYDTRFGKGWDYGYVFPAFTKALQSAGRCIRSETDRGVIVFVDERYAWDRYYACFPMDMTPKTTEFYAEAIDDFFARKG
ncbi:ATP-dependent DNA helicase [Candidatus Woesearchaeota archaeon]|nr:ATP-dependent DNA helicase [Candidatus Woesearchaeota archaeon]